LILLSGPPSLLIVVQPGVEVNAVVDAAAAEADRGDAQPVEERETDAEVFGGLGPGEAANHRARKRSFIHRQSRTGGCAGVPSVAKRGALVHRLERARA
jgi:hypothetical protein